MLPFTPDTATATPVQDSIARLNAVKLRAAQLQMALERLAGLPAHLRDKPAAQAMALQVYSDEEGLSSAYASAALHARVTALAKWTAAHDPKRQSNAEAVIEAAAQFALSDSEAGICFEPAGFQEMILFIEELPW